MDKAALRQRVIARVRALPPARRALEEELVTAAIQDAPEWRAARTVMLYRSVGWEFGTVALANAAWRAGKRTLFPRQAGDSLEAVAAGSWGTFVPGPRGMVEPVGAAAGPDEADLAIIPGVAFDMEGGRLGRGAGCYDRFLPSLRCPAWGVGFDAQLLDVAEMPREAHDHPLALVWTCQSRGLENG